MILRFYSTVVFFYLIFMQFLVLILLCSCNYAPCDAGFYNGFINILNTLHFSDGLPVFEINKYSYGGELQ